MILSIIGNGGLSRELQAYMRQVGLTYNVYVSDEYYTDNTHVLKLSELDVSTSLVIVAISDPDAKEKIVNTLPKETNYFTFIHPTAIIYSEDSIGGGSIVAPNTVVTTDVKIGKHCLLNVGITVGHDTVINDYCTINPGASISGNCILEKNIFVGTNAAIREKVTISHHTIIGMGAVVVKDITTPNKTYVGVPARCVE